MDNVFTRSWTLAKLSFSVIRLDKELLLFPFLSAFFSLLILVAFWLPARLFLSHSSWHHSAIPWILLFLLYFVLTFLSTFFNVCAVHIIKKRLEGSGETLSDSFAFAFSRMNLIVSWSLVAATVSVLLRVLEAVVGNRKSSNPLGLIIDLVMGLFVMGLKLSWSIVTLFVVPAMVYKDLGPMEALKDSTRAIQKTWGESLARNYGLELIEFLVLALGIGLLALLGWGLGTAMASFAWTWGVLAFLGIGYICIVLMVFSMANTVFNTALYAYASTGMIPSGYSKEVLENAFKPKG